MSKKTRVKTAPRKPKAKKLTKHASALANAIISSDAGDLGGALYSTVLAAMELFQVTPERERVSALEALVIERLQHVEIKRARKSAKARAE